MRIVNFVEKIGVGFDRFTADTSTSITCIMYADDDDDDLEEHYQKPVIVRSGKEHTIEATGPLIAFTIPMPLTIPIQLTKGDVLTIECEAPLLGWWMIFGAKKYD